MNDPYKTLGIDPNCTNEELKQAYRSLVKKYHPDNYADAPELASVADEKMKEINSAYDEILKIRIGKATGYNNNPDSNGTKGQSYGAGFGQSSSKNPIYNQIRQEINKENFRYAEQLLSSIKQEEREAEWFFLHGCILLRGGYYFDALKYIENACRMDPNNQEYRQVYQSILTQAQGYNQAHQPQSSGGDCEDGLCRLCCAIQFIDCFCGGCR